MRKRKPPSWIHDGFSLGEAIAAGVILGLVIAVSWLTR